MKLIALFFAIMLAGFGGCDKVKAQETQNVLGNSWTGTVNYTGAGGGLSGGNVPGYNSTTNTLFFGYSQATVAQTIAINNALQGSGVQIGGLKYGFSYYNEGSNYGTLSTTVNLTSNTGTTLQSYYHSLGATTGGWTSFDQTKTFDSQYPLEGLGNVSMSITGKDSRFWAGYYGPMVKDAYIKATYTVDPCVANPAYSPSCPNYNSVLTTQNITATSYAINQALSLSGSGVMLHGFDYGYTVTFGNQYCSSWFLVCFSYSDSSASVAAVVTDNNSNTIYSRAETHSGADSTNNYSFNYRFPSSRAIGTLGAFAFGEATTGNASVSNYWSNWKYSPDPCVIDPLSSQSCPGYAEAYFNQQCSISALFNPQCPGYAVAYFTQQCTIDSLYNPACPGYATAYLNLQCSINPLYSTTCSGYESAYLNQQCSINPLYSSKCNGYAQAYFNQQCSLNGLYDKTCPNYAEAYAKKNVLNIDTTGTSTQTQTTTTTSTVSTTAPSTTVSSDGSVSTSVSKTGDSNVDKAITPTTTTTNSSAAPAAPVQLVQPSPSSQQQSTEKKDGPSAQTASQSPQTNTQTNERGSGPGEQKTARQELQERREAAVKKDAVEKGKNLANEMGKAANMEQQVAVQNVVLQAMGFTPGFDSYSKAIILDGPMYKPHSIYNNQKTIDNRRATFGLFGATDRLHEEMTNQQYLKDSK